MDFEFLEEEFKEGVWSDIRDMTRKEARLVYQNISKVDYFLAVEFMEQFRYFSFTGRLMEVA